uniref:Uncharacterized protein n=1 Tax=Rhizophora mucronata TaxID=61149 RepID=A0A2P2PKB1_RHIMU
MLTSPAVGVQPSHPIFVVRNVTAFCSLYNVFVLGP